LNIYAMDRDYYTLRQYDELLTDMGHSVRCFSNPGMLRETLAAAPPELVIIESDLPSLSSLVTESRMKAPGLDFVFASGGGELTPTQLNLQPAGRIQKPITGEKLGELMQLFKSPLRMRAFKGFERINGGLLAALFRKGNQS